jgi:Domain of unknown function (DUF5668)
MNDKSDYRNLRAIRGPIMVITVGVLFALNNFTQYNFGETWPVLIIVAGLISLLGRGTSQPTPPPAPPYSTYQPPVAPTYAPPTAPPGGYRQTPYAQTNDPQNPGGRQ